MEVHLSDAERVFIVHGVQEGIRNDGRGASDYRPIRVETGVLSTTLGSARVRLASTDVLVGVKAEIDEIDCKQTEKKGRIRFFVDCSANATPLFAGKGGEEMAEFVSTALTDAYSNSMALDLSKLVVSTTKAWTVFVDVVVLECGGNLTDAAALGAKAALADARLANVRIKASDSEKSEIELTDDAYFDSWQLDVTAAPLLVTVNKIGWSNVVDASLQEEVCTKSALVVGVASSPAKGDLVTLVRQTGRGSLEPDSVDEMIALGVRAGNSLNRELDRILVDIGRTQMNRNELVSAAGFLSS
uniref:Ribosomal RNA-processing protein 42 n=1 Tax=Plectus sambesii TaxID=2011161 RepID=A0A914WCQ7_9BILA